MNKLLSFLRYIFRPVKPVQDYVREVSPKQKPKLVWSKEEK